MLYTRKHTWSEITPVGYAKVGVSDFVCGCKLTEIIRVWTEDIGKPVKQMEPFGVVESWRFTFDLCAPFSGQLKALNKETLENPSMIGEDPHGSGWIAEIEPAEPEKEAKTLLKSEEYTIYCKELCLACPKKNCELAHC